MVTSDSEEVKQAREVDGGDVGWEITRWMSGMRCGRRVRIAGHDVLLWRGRIEVHGGQES